MGSAVLADGKIDKGSNIINANVLNTTNNTKANNNFVPTIAAEYFISPNFSVETICCLTQHTVRVTGTPSLSNAMDHVLILPATLTAKAHLPLGRIKPYIGAGISHFFFMGEKPGSSLPSAVTRAKLDNTFGAVVQAGVDIPISDKGYGISLDAKRYFMRPRSHFYAGNTEVLSAKHKLDPWVLSAGVSYRF